MTVEADERDRERVCDVEGCSAWRTGENPYCHHHKGLAQTPGAPEGNQNARIHGGFGDWELAYEQFDDDTRETVDKIVASHGATAAENAPEVPADERRELCREYVTLGRMKEQAGADAWCGPDDPDGRGFVVKREREIGDETVTVERPNPAFRAEHTLRRRRREIAERLKLRPGLRGE